MAPVKYKLIKNFFNKKELNILKKYCFNKLDKDQEYGFDGQTFSPSWYNDPLMKAFLDTKWSKVELESNLKLFPSFCYWRYYVFGAELKKHIDRPSCEVSITSCIKKYDNWPIVVEGTSFELEEGDGVLYAGCDEKHWRPGVYKGEGMAQVFLHYVDQKGPYTQYADDGLHHKKQVELVKKPLFGKIYD